jgi:beta-mannanase
MKYLLILFLLCLQTTACFASSKLDFSIPGCYTGAMVDWQTVKDDNPYVMTDKDLATYQDITGKKCAIISSYMAFQYDGVPYSFPIDMYKRIQANNSVMLLTWEPRDWDSAKPEYFDKSILRDIISGKYDAYIDSWAMAIKGLDGPLLLRFAPEMNIDNMAWSGSMNGSRESGAKTYIYAFRHVHNRFTKLGVDNVQWVWTPINWGLPFEPWNHYSNYYPGDDYVDVVAMDEYNWGTTQTWSKWQSFNDIYWKFYSELSSLYPDKPLIIGEFSCANQGGDKAAWIKDTFVQMKENYPRIKAFVWFHKNNKNGIVNNMAENSDWSIDSTQKSASAAREALKDGYFIPEPVIAR